MDNVGPNKMIDKFSIFAACINELLAQFTKYDGLREYDLLNSDTMTLVRMVQIQF